MGRNIRVMKMVIRLLGSEVFSMLDIFPKVEVNLTVKVFDFQM
jgi:hypothetical protein